MTVSRDNENLLRLKIRFSCTCIMIPCFYKKEKKTEEKK